MKLMLYNIKFKFIILFNTNFKYKINITNVDLHYVYLNKF